MRNQNQTKHKQHVFGFVLLLAAIVALGVALYLINAGGDEASDQPASTTATTQSGTATRKVLEDSSREDIGIATSVVWNGQRYRKRANQDLCLLIGYDTETHVDDQRYKGGLADFLVLVVIDYNGRTVNLLQIDRDTMVRMKTYDNFGQRSGSKVYQLCIAHYFLATPAVKAANTREAVESLLNLQINVTASMGLTSIKALTDGIGGVTVTVRDDMTGLGEEFESFEQGATVTLTGDMTERYVRARKGITEGSNVSRMMRQRDFIDGFISQVKARIREDSGYLKKLDTLLKENILMTSTSNYGWGWIYTTLNKIDSQDFTISEPVMLNKNGSEARNAKNNREFYLNDDEVIEWVLATLYQPEK
ncbi:MAG: LCP family protein [Clostridia bacterium]|nr:LCP family protein [Clostridia bacterium]